MIDLRFQSAETPLPRPKGGWQRSRFRAKYGQTLNALEQELKHLGARDIVVVADMPREQIRMDGWPRSTARPRTPGVTITFTCKHGAMRYDCNTFDDYEDNLRAFALTLEQLRAIDRYGCTQGQQYAGWRALPPGEGTRSGGGFSSAEDAAAFLLRVVGVPAHADNARGLVGDTDRLRLIYREAARRAHPDAGGSAEQMARVNEARDMIVKARHS